MIDPRSNTVLPEFSGIFVLDISYDNQKLIDEAGSIEMAAKIQRDWVRSIAGFSPSEVNIGAGADVPAYYTLIKDYWVPAFGIMAVVFFSGKRIEENIYSWLRMARSIREFFSRPVFLSRTRLLP